MTASPRLLKQGLQIAVVLGAVFLVALDVVRYSSKSANSTVSAEDDSQRNERSTPRSFVLPATPGVALEQESQAKATRGKAGTVGRCVAELRVAGYKIYGDEVLENVKVVQAIFQFQAVSELSTTGRLDEATMKALKCESK